MSSESPEPKGSASSSPGDRCGRCPHKRLTHTTVMPFECTECADGMFHTFVLETAEPEAHEHDWSEWGAVYHGGDLQWRDCRACGDHETRLPEPEAPEEGPHVCKPGATLYYCPTADEIESDCHGGFDACCSAPEKHVQVHPAPPRRPAYATAYALASGELYEVALSGDAVATVEDGVLKVSHPAGVARIVQVKPIEGP